MIIKVGYILQLSAILLDTLILLYLLYKKLSWKKEILPCFIYIDSMFYLGRCFAIFSFLVFIYNFIISNFQLKIVFFYSSTLTPFIFKLAASWVSYEGSLLLWINLLNFISLLYKKFFLAKCFEPFETIMLSLINLIINTFALITLKPFSTLLVNPIEGLGLNPILQDIHLTIHPIILYLGYSCYLIPFINVCNILLHHNITNTIVLRSTKIFSTLGMIFLTAGISLGSKWAYEQLNWGGFWYFDPVENIALMYWFLAVTLHHSLILSVKRKCFSPLVIILAIIMFPLSIFSSFLIRSKLLISVHSFDQQLSSTNLLLVFFLMLLIYPIMLLLFKNKALILKRSIIADRKEFLINTSNNIWLVSALLLFITIMYPITYYYIFNVISLITADFFITYLIPILIINITLLSISFSKVKNRFILLIFLLITSFFINYYTHYSYLSIISIIISTFIIIKTTNILFLKASRVNISSLLGHLGFSMLFFSITVNHLFKNEIEFVGNTGNSTYNARFYITLSKIDPIKGANYIGQAAKFLVYDKITKKMIMLKPENRLYITENSLSQKSDKFSCMTYDIIAMILKIEEDTVFCKIHYQPMICLIWLSVIIIIISLNISLLKS